MTIAAAPQSPSNTDPQRHTGAPRVQPASALDTKNAKHVAECMRKSGVSLTKAIEIAERQLKGQAIDARCHSMGTETPMLMDVTVIDAAGTVRVAAIDLTSGTVTSSRTPGTSEGDRASLAHTAVLKGSAFPGHDVVDAANKKIGDITEIAIDEARGRAAYVLVNLDSSNHVIAVPWTAIHHDGLVCRLDSRGTRNLDSAPRFESSNWPTMSSDEFGQPIAEFYGEPVYGRDVSLPPGTTCTLIKLSDVIGMDIQSPTGDDLGEIEDVVFDPDSGRISYAALSFGGFMGFNDKLFAVPWDALAARKDGKVILAVDKDRLHDAPGFDKKNWPTVSNPTFDAEVRTYYKKRTASVQD